MKKFVLCLVLFTISISLSAENQGYIKISHGEFLEIEKMEGSCHVFSNPEENSLMIAFEGKTELGIEYRFILEKRGAIPKIYFSTDDGLLKPKEYSLLEMWEEDGYYYFSLIFDDEITVELKALIVSE